MRVIRIALGVVVGIVVSAPTARAESVKDAAKAEWEQGTVEYTLGHFEAAARAYEEAYRLVADPALLFNLGQARRRAGEAEAAISAYKSFLRLSQPDAPDRDAAERRIQDLEAAEAAQAQAAGHAPVNLTLPASEGSMGPVLLSPAPGDGGRRLKPWWLWSAAGAVVVAAGIAVLVLLAKPQQDVVPGKDGTVTIR
jgi:tetratricopeptide (TPR) repeat protein